MTYNIVTNFGRVVASAATKDEADKMAWDMDNAAFERGVRGAHFDAVPA